MALMGFAAFLTFDGSAQAQQFNRNVIVNSGNGVGNTISIRNGGGGYVDPYFGGGGNYNSTRIIDSGNGYGNSIRVSNGPRSPFGGYGGYPQQFGGYGGYPQQQFGNGYGGYQQQPYDGGYGGYQQQPQFYGNGYGYQR